MKNKKINPRVSGIQHGIRVQDNDVLKRPRIIQGILLDVDNHSRYVGSIEIVLDDSFTKKDALKFCSDVVVRYNSFVTKYKNGKKSNIIK